MVTVPACCRESAALFEVSQHRHWMQVQSPISKFFGPTGNLSKDFLAGDLLHALSHRHENTWTAFVEPVVSTGGDKKKTF